MVISMSHNAYKMGQILEILLCSGLVVSHQSQVTELSLDDKLDSFVLLEFIWLLAKNNLAIYLRPVLPLRTDGSPLTSIKLTCP